jgi:riboflavin kinase/FMN adenylyltransferase
MSTHMKFSGIVLEGSKKASLLGFPTANIKIAEKISGIYAGTVTVGNKSLPAAIFGDARRGLLEAHILNFSDNLYGITIECALIKKIREHAVFTDDDSLRIQIEKDVEEVRGFFSSTPLA